MKHGLRWSSLGGVGVRLMRRWRLSTKIAVLVGVLIVPLLLLQGMAMRHEGANQALAAREYHGAVLSADIVRIMGQVLRVRDEGGQSQGVTPAAEAALRGAVATMDQHMAADTGFDLGKAWTVQRARLQDMAGAGAADGVSRDAAVIERVAGLRQLLGLVAERSALLFDPEPLSYFLMDVAIERLPVVLMRLSDLTDISGEGVAASVSLRLRAQALQEAVAEARNRMDAAVRAGGVAPASWESALAAASGHATQANEQALALGRGLADATGTAQDAVASRPVVLDAAPVREMLLQAHQDIVNRLGDQLAQRERDSRANFWLSILLSLGGLLVMLYLAYSFYVGFEGSVRAVSQAVRAIAAGNLATTVSVAGEDELAETGDELEAMADRLSSMVSDIRSTAVRVGQSGTRVAQDGQALAERTEEQAASLRQSLASVQQLTAAVASNAQAANRLNTLTNDLRERSEEGAVLMRDTVGSIHALEERTRRVAEINRVIDDIAFQTNLLALNASVEAARAGESGKGFAVVASEVRQLAQRCAEAADEIRSLIEQTTEQVDEVTHRVEGVSDTLVGMVQGVGEVSNQLGLIAQASEQQSRGLDEVAQAVASLDVITHQNVEAVGRSSEASSSLVAQAQALETSVASIRLRQGSADEAQALVQRALDRLHEVGWQQAARELNAPRNGYVDRDLYIFVLDRNGRYHVHSAKPELVGQTVYQTQVIDPGAFMVNSIEQLARGPGWVEYTAVHPVTGRPTPKASYMVPVDDDVFIGCGVYRSMDARDDALATVASATARGAAQLALS